MSPRPFSTFVKQGPPPSVPHAMTIGGPALCRLLGIPEGSNITAIWLDLAGTISVSWEEPPKRSTPLQTFYTEARG